MLKTYYLLTKPGIIIGNLITTAAAFVLGSAGHFSGWLFLYTMAGLGCVIASACVFNNYIDRHLDQKMARTKNRAFATGSISVRSGLTFAISLGILGLAILALYTNFLAVAVASLGFFVYVILYSLWKTRSGYATLVGSISGAVPPVVGYCAAKGTFDLGALILFAILVLWQMPHFFSIAMYRLDDYASASVPVLPVKKGIRATKIQMVLYIISFILACSLLLVFGYTGVTYLVITTLLGLAWLALCFQGFKCTDDKKWARQMFRLSLVVITALSATISFT